eukprot:3580687-Karenia_brevis.AAC.1
MASRCPQIKSGRVQDSTQMSPDDSKFSSYGFKMAQHEANYAPNVAIFQKISKISLHLAHHPLT